MKFFSIDYKIHLLIALVTRLVLIVYGVYHDQVSTVQYTDVDYKVYSDAARLVSQGRSPYERHTYRYTPLLAFILVPNVVFENFGKILFCLIDLIDALLIRAIVKNALIEHQIHVLKSKRVENEPTQAIKGRNRKNHRSKSKLPGTKAESDNEIIANIALVAWLYNPLTLAIGTRGSCDAITALLVLSTLYYLQCKKNSFIAGFIHGLAIHFRLYPIIYSLTFYMYLSKYSYYSTEDRRTIKLNQSKTVANIEHGEKRTIFKKEYLYYLLPNLDQILLMSGCVFTLAFPLYIFHAMYGHKFVYETYLYHLIRKDTRHNFSLYFYLQYLTAYIKNIGLWQKVLTVLPQLVLVLVFSFRYGLNKFCLNFSILVQTIVMVTYNAVLTSQYFVWIMAVLPLCLWQIKMSIKGAIFLMAIWFAAQAAWLLPAYLLEFQGQNTFLFIWIQSVSFFCANIAILGRLVMNFGLDKEKIV